MPGKGRTVGRNFSRYRRSFSSNFLFQGQCLAALHRRFEHFCSVHARKRMQLLDRNAKTEVSEGLPPARQGLLDATTRVPSTSRIKAGAARSGRIWLWVLSSIAAPGWSTFERRRKFRLAAPRARNRRGGQLQNGSSESTAPNSSALRASSLARSRALPRLLQTLNRQMRLTFHRRIDATSALCRKVRGEDASCMSGQVLHPNGGNGWGRS